MTKAEIILVEGLRDESLLRKIFKKCFKYEPIFYQYSNKLKSDVIRFVSGLNNKNIPYLFFTDFDPEQFSSFCDRKKSRIQEFGIKRERIVVVKSEIESWYAAGSYSSDLNKKDYSDEAITKQLFCSLIDEPNYPEVILQKILLRFNPVRARKNSLSFKYFVEKVKKLNMNNSKGRRSTW